MNHIFLFLVNPFIIQRLVLRKNIFCMLQRNLTVWIILRSPCLINLHCLTFVIIIKNIFLECMGFYFLLIRIYSVHTVCIIK